MNCEADLLIDSPFNSPRPPYTHPALTLHSPCTHPGPPGVLVKRRRVGEWKVRSLQYAVLFSLPMVADRASWSKCNFAQRS